MAFVVSTIYSIHTWTGCPIHNIGDLMIRFILYCGVCALLMFGGQVVQQSNDKYTQMRNVKWIACFVLFTAWAVLIPGFFVIQLSVYTHAFYRAKNIYHETTVQNTHTSADNGHANVASSTILVGVNLHLTSHGTSNTYNHGSGTGNLLSNPTQHLHTASSGAIYTTTPSLSKNTHQSNETQALCSILMSPA